MRSGKAARRLWGGSPPPRSLTSADSQGSVTVGVPARGKRESLGALDTPRHHVRRSAAVGAGATRGLGRPIGCAQVAREGGGRQRRVRVWDRRAAATLESPGSWCP